MATEIKNYHILFYGTPDGYQTNRAQIALYGPNGKTAAYMRFNDPGMTFENDCESGGIIPTHHPSTMFENVLDVLRNVETNLLSTLLRGEMSYPHRRNM